MDHGEANISFMSQLKPSDIASLAMVIGITLPPADRIKYMTLKRELFERPDWLEEMNAMGYETYVMGRDMFGLLNNVKRVDAFAGRTMRIGLCVLTDMDPGNEVDIISYISEKLRIDLLKSCLRNTSTVVVQSIDNDSVDSYTIPPLVQRRHPEADLETEIHLLYMHVERKWFNFSRGDAKGAYIKLGFSRMVKIKVGVIAGRFTGPEVGVYAPIVALNDTRRSCMVMCRHPYLIPTENIYSIANTYTVVRSSHRIDLHMLSAVFGSMQEFLL
jgi:hypothetical protein